MKQYKRVIDAARFSDGKADFSGEGMALNFDLTTEEGRLSFITHTWPGTAGLAYAGYKAYNRGAVIFASGYERPMYVPLEGNDFGNESIVQAVKEYDPEKEIVVVFFLKKPPVVHSKYAIASLPPAKAYKLFMKMH